MKNHAGIGDLDGGRRGKRRRWSTHMVALVAIALSFMVIPTAGAQDGGSLEVPVSTVVRTAPGVETLLASLEVPTDFIGTSCGVETASENNRSVHPGNNIVVASGGASVTLFDVESTSGQISTAESPLTLGSEVTITLVMGPDGVFSGGASAFVVFDCAPPTTTSTTTTSTSTSTTTEAPTTTSTSTVPPTSSIEGPTTTSLPPATTVPVTPPTLAVTGAGETLVIAFAGIVLLDLGYLVFSTRRPAPVRGRDD